MRLKVSEHFRYLGNSGEETSEDLLWHLVEREGATLLLQRIDDFIEAQKIPDQGQILTVTGLFGVSKGSGDDAEAGNTLALPNRS